MRPATPAPLLPVVPGAVSRPHSSATAIPVWSVRVRSSPVQDCHSEIAYWEESELREQNLFMARLL